MELQVKKFKVDISARPAQNLLHGPYHDPQSRGKLLIPPI